jgi:CDP-paratose 2-epimerase
MKIIVTGNAGLVGSEAAEYFDERGHKVYGFDNNARKYFFGSDGDTTPTKKRQMETHPNIQQLNVDITDRQLVIRHLENIRPDVVIHCAAQPSHDWAAKEPFKDFDTNVVGTHNMLEATRLANPDAIFIHLSTNKVYGDAPNKLDLVELPTRWEYDTRDMDDDITRDVAGWSSRGIAENFTIDQSTHSVFGADKAAGDLLVQEYGRYFGMRTCALRGGCLTGVRHSGAELHGFLSYFFKAAKEGRKYTIFGYKGKQVRDQIYSYDIARFMEEFIAKPRCGEVYNLGGGKNNSVSILECIDRVQQLGFKLDYTYDEVNRIGDHICYYSDLSKMKEHYPNWDVTYNLDKIFNEFAKASKT